MGVVGADGDVVGFQFQGDAVAHPEGPGVLGGELEAAGPVEHGVLAGDQVLLAGCGVDLAVAQGGNVEGSRPDEAVLRHGVTVIGYRNTPSHLAAESSALYARNLFNFLAAYWDKERKAPVLPDDDEIVQAVRLTRAGAVVHPKLQPGGK